MSIAIDKQPIAESLALIASIHLLKSLAIKNKNDVPSNTGGYLNNVYYSHREIQILHYSSKGRTAREIASILCLSKRTIENYLGRIKYKLGVLKKSDMIDVFIECQSSIQYTDKLLRK